MSGTPDPVVVLLTLVFLALAPFMAIMVTSFAKLVIVLSLVRNALGLQQIPPNLVLNGLALVLSMYIMAPLGLHIMKSAEERLGTGPLQTQALFKVISDARAPLQQFLGKHAQPREREFDQGKGRVLLERPFPGAACLLCLIGRPCLEAIGVRGQRFDRRAANFAQQSRRIARRRGRRRGANRRLLGAGAGAGHHEHA